MGIFQNKDQYEGYNIYSMKKYVDKKIGSLSINYSVDALGRVLDGDNGTIINKNYNSIDGVKISIDEKLQKIAEASSKKISKGSVVILDTNTSQILASVSLGGDYLNRSLRPYAIGSIFRRHSAYSLGIHGIPSE